MDGFKNTTRMKTFGDVAPQAYAKGGSVKPAAKVGKVMGEFAEGKLHSGSKTGPKVTNKKQAIAIGISEAKKAGAKGPMKKANGGEIVRMTDAEHRASLEVPSRGMTPAEARALRATMAAKAAAPKREPLIGRGTISDRDEGRALRAMPKNSNPMSPAEVRRLIEMDRPTNKMGAEAYKGGGKVGASKVPFAVKKVMRKAEGGAVTAPQAMTSVMPTQTQAERDAMAAQKAAFDAQYNTPEAIAASQKAQAESLAMQQRWAASDAGRTNGTSGGGTFTADGTYVPNPQGTSPGPSPEMPQEPTPQSVFGTALPATAGRTADQYATTQGQPVSPVNEYGFMPKQPRPMPTMPNEGLMPPPPKGVGIDPDLMRRISYQFTPEGRARTQAMLEASNRADAARAADQAATLQAQQEMAAQAQMDRGLGRGLAPMYGRGAPPRFMR